MKVKYLIILLGMCLGIQSFAQTNPTPSSPKTTLADSNLKALEGRLIDSELQRVRDSIRNALIIIELQNAKSSKNAKDINSQISKIKEEDSLQLIEQKNNIQELKKTTTGIPVMLFNDTLFNIYTSIGSFGPQKRAEEVQNKIIELFNDVNFNPENLHISESYGITSVLYNDKVIYALGTNDALWEDVSQKDLAQKLILEIAQKVDKNKKLYSWQNVAIRWTKALLIIAIVGILFILIKRIFNRISLYLAKNQNRFVKEIKIKKYELFSKHYLYRLFQKFIFALKIVCLGAVLYAGISLLFSVFPATQHYTNVLYHWFLDPLKKVGISIFNYLPNLFEVAILIFIFRYVIRIVRYFSLEIEKGELRIKGFHPEWSQTTYTLIRIILIAFCLILIFPNLPGSDSKAFQGISVFVGVLLSLGSSSAISNSIAGFIITYMRPFKKGDWIKVGTTTGYVKEKTLLVTRLTTINNEDVTIPNSTILTSQTINYSSTKNQDGLAITAEVTMAYAIPWRTIHDVLLNAAKQTHHLNRSKAPFILQKSLESYYVKYSLNVYTKQPEKMYYIHTELLKNIQDCFNAAGIDLHLPQQISIVEPKPTSINEPFSPKNWFNKKDNNKE